MSTPLPPSSADLAGVSPAGLAVLLHQDQRRRWRAGNRPRVEDYLQRWPDLREVMKEFEKLEADYLLEDAREKIEQEKRRQARRVWLLRTAAPPASILPPQSARRALR